MKNLIPILAICTLAVPAFASSTSEYVVETGAMVVTEQAAMDLYNDVDAKEKVLSSITRQEQREKKKGSVRCTGEFIRGLNEGNEMGEWQLVDAECSIKIPVSVIGPRE